MGPEDLIGSSAAARALLTEISEAAGSDAKVLLTGESGVGKEVVAGLIHHQSRRRNVRLIALNCAAIPESLLESELFGHTRGSFTGAYRDKAGLLELSHHGTIFLDEVGETSLRMQALLLRFLENGEIWRIGADRMQARSDVRVIAATNRDLTDRIARREFRADLYYRLNVLHIRIPPLRERRDDIPLFLEHFFRACAERSGETLHLTTDARAALMDYEWPGNIRELRNVVERLAVRRHTGPIELADLPPEIRTPSFRRRPATAGCGGAAGANRADELYDRMVREGESFWSAVHPLFTHRDITRADLRAIVSRGLAETRGSYRQVLQLFNMPPEDYKPFLNLLRKHQCHIAYLKYRCLPAAAAGDAPGQSGSGGA